ncbi:ABC transporter transmembrane protein [Arthrobacter sp. AG367]|nr:ABC transporter transmembrane protein [Arthrobacter sp. AG367]
MAQFISGLIMAAMTFIGDLVYVGIAVVGGLQVASGAMQLGDVQAFIHYSRQVIMPLAQLGCYRRRGLQRVRGRETAADHCAGVPGPGLRC